MSFARLRHPEWRESIEADASVMFMEVLAALGDELAYVQDRYSREAYLRTASQRRSLRRLVRLVDYEIHDGRSGTTWIEITVDADTLATAGTRVWADWVEFTPKDGLAIVFGAKDDGKVKKIVLDYKKGDMTGDQLRGKFTGRIERV